MCRRGVLVSRAHRVFALQLLAPLATWVAADHKPGVDETLPEEPGEHRLGHHAGADDAELRVAQRVFTHGAPP